MYPDSSTRTLPLSKDRVALVDDEDYEMLSHWKWHLITTKTGEYACRNIHWPARGYGFKIMLHRAILLPSPDEQIDHINGDGLDNRRCNLRLCTQTENSRNQRKTRGSSRYKGVCWSANRKRWQVDIKSPERRIFLGYFTDETQAGLAYDQAARDLFGDFACLNFDE